ncbi:pentapeptide repeat-containing protein [Dolichospermum sp. ST_con]|nr:pentapeptide repeat-containing protein [Dolichospermum sp. ST_con]MDD1419118.1 pentapeptide repeat-containing protein [Dolichospermum sp. ST_sed1]MDD1424839.1 pentapeptide repeat-containing protein [Dolichospermum sp. ST_sed9]MDD1431363.1 pentapeptide repeat-containing protein [Dolichospermum sp. ST_sed6]MDD1435381.1 pentapeptide repeat-containing protein [Dolichospermum sp. ST_sed10]MDD1440782.1 pentapeptide repeat-containing protein [Dolichospermum sp. ST_sed3]MDD1444588.1 pentapeptide r
MANDKHLAILRQGIEVWNNWVFPTYNLTRISPNLSEANLSGVNLRGANLYYTNLSNANLSGADLRETYLYAADLSGADLRDANLTQVTPDIRLRDSSHSPRTDFSKANLSNANLSSAYLRAANLSNANLSSACLHEANLSDANLRGACLHEANLSNANLHGADLRDANLRDAHLIGADLSYANLSCNNLSTLDLRDANLYGVNLSNANLSNANLSGADLSDADLSKSQVIGTNFHNANITGACIKDWHINSETKLDTIVCNFVYLFYYDICYWEHPVIVDQFGYEGEYRQQESRIPLNGDFAPGEFASLYKNILESTDLILRKNIQRPQLQISKLDTTINNQGIEFYSNSKIHTWQNLRFRSKTEIKIAEALDRTGVLFVPNSLARLNTAKGRENKEADFLICYNGKWGVLEVDGPFHTAERRVEEQERERIFKKNGIKVVERFDSERCYNHPDEVVQEFFKMIEIGYS